MYTLAIVILGSILVGITAGAIGVFAVLRRQSLLGDAISHAALPGIALAFWWGETTNPFLLTLGGGVAGCVGALLVILIARTTSLKQDALLGIILSVFFGFGVVIKTMIQQRGLAHQSVLGKFFFGNASTLLPVDIAAIALVTGLILLLLIFFWKEFVLVAFDPEFAYIAGYPAMLLDVILTIMTVVAIVIGLHAVGVLLMSALLIAPAAAARQWSNSVREMMLLAIFFGGSSGGIGALISSQVEHLPTGPTIVVCLSMFVIISLVFAPRRMLGRGEI